MFPKDSPLFHSLPEEVHSNAVSLTHSVGRAVNDLFPKMLFLHLFFFLSVIIISSNGKTIEQVWVAQSVGTTRRNDLPLLFNTN